MEEESAGSPVSQLKILGAGETGQEEGRRTGLAVLRSRCLTRLLLLVVAESDRISFRLAANASVVSRCFAGSRFARWSGREPSSSTETESAQETSCPQQILDGVSAVLARP